MLDEIKKDAAVRMGKSVASLQSELTKIRTGRAHTSLLDHITVEYYGSQVPLNQASNVGIEDSRTLTVTPWEKDMVPVIEKAIMGSDLGLNPSSAGTVIRVPLPALTEERRKEIVKRAHDMAESARNGIRQARREGNDGLKAMERDKEISQDQQHTGFEETQKLHDHYIAEVAKTLDTKEQDILTG